MNRFVALFYNLRCCLNFHTEVMIDKSEDPFRGILGHIATSRCSWCDKHRRYLGHDGKVRFVMPWVSEPKAKDDE